MLCSLSLYDLRPNVSVDALCDPDRLGVLESLWNECCGAGETRVAEYGEFIPDDLGRCSYGLVGCGKLPDACRGLDKGGPSGVVGCDC